MTEDGGSSLPPPLSSLLSPLCVSLFVGMFNISLFYFRILA
ncbi:hypothetical protein EDWATA_02991 [Edwardsiella tarda ATCC 23685]|uniref:Uncharacterized protein n=1 Tax=Edwardsiella tarda ATCC 23685 TaxID=500638 RepID=D4F8A4_EDWTA|nr:hypothetical protein EDWATA_02991 [Edwardsiella tarda ATCC 23685]